MKPVDGATAPRRHTLDRAAEAWRERAGRLYAEFEQQAIGMVRRAFRDAFGAQEIEDIYSGAWLGTLRALERRQAAMSDEEVRKYLLRAVANQAVKELRRRKRKPTAPLELVDGVRDHGSAPDERAAEAEASRVTRDLLLSLPPRRRAVIMLRYGWGLEPAQVCALVRGLSPRAYRKEVTRGVDELTERMRRLEAGTWCADREPLLKAMVAGVAAEDEERQARAHLSHCRECSEFVAGLRGHLHDLGGSLAAPPALDGIDGELVLDDGAGGLADRVRDAASGLLGRSEAEMAQEVVRSGVAAGGTRGAGAAGAGALAKLAGIGAAGKAAVACLGGGAAATVCIAAGVGPLGGGAPPGEGRDDGDRPAAEQPADVPAADPVPADSLPSQLGEEQAAPEAPASDSGGEEEPVAEEPVDSVPVVGEAAPAVEQEFGVASAAPAPSPEPSSSGGGGSTASAVEQEFGP